MPRRQPRHRFGHPVHPTLDQPHTLRLQMRDQHQRRRRLERRCPTIGRITPIKLDQPRIAEMLAQRPPQRLERVDRQHLRHPRQPEPRRQPDRRGRRRRHEPRIQRIPDALCFSLECIPPPGLRRPGKLRYRIMGPRRIPPQIEPRTIPPAMPRQPLGVHQRQMVIQVLAKLRKQRIENRLRREHRRPGIHRHPAAIDRPQLAAGRRHPLHHRHRQAAPCQQRRRTQPAHPGPDDHHG